MDEIENKDFHRFAQFLIDHFEDDEVRFEFESFVLMTHTLIKKELRDLSFGLFIEQLIKFNGVSFVVPHYANKISASTLSWIQKRFYNDMYSFFVFSFGADQFGKMELTEKDITVSGKQDYYQCSKEFQTEMCRVRLDGEKICLLGKEFFSTSITVSVN